MPKHDFILDACCGGKMFWYAKHLPFVTYQDIRRETLELCDGRIYRVEPNHIGDFTHMDFPDKTFTVVIFDPPHLNQVGKNSWLRKKYGSLPKDWERTICAGFIECFRVLQDDGILVFKWAEEQIPYKSVVRFSPYRPILGDKTGKKRWTLFLKNELLRKGGTNG